MIASILTATGSPSGGMPHGTSGWIAFGVGLVVVLVLVVMRYARRQ